MYRAIIIGGSAGSFQVVARILSTLDKDFPVPVLLVLHRLKHVRSGFVEALSIKSSIPVKEPVDKDYIRPGFTWLAPSNYHLYVESGNRFALSTEPQVNHSRPSVDLSFFSAAKEYRRNLAGIILSGANKDGAAGLKMVGDMGGTTIVQDPSECQVPVMPLESMKLTKVHYVYNTEQIVSFFKKIRENGQNRQ